MPRLIYLVFTVIAACLIAACNTTPQPRATADDPLAGSIPEFLAEQVKLRENLEQGHPRELDETEWSRLNGIHAEFDRLLGDIESVDELSEEDRVRFYSLRRQMILLLVGDPEDQIVCTRNTHAIGTRLKPRRRCVSLAQLERERFNARYIMQYMESSQPIGLEPDGE